MRTGIQNKIEFYAIPKLPEGVRSTATSTLSRGRGRKGSLYFSNSWTVHSADHGFETGTAQISSYSQKVNASKEYLRNRTRMILAGFVVMVASFPTVALLIKPVTGLNLVAKMFANAIAGMAAISIIHPVESFLSAGGKDQKVRHLFNGIGDALASQILLRSMTILSYTYFHSLISSAWAAAAAAWHGLAGVGLASLATGVVMALVSAPLEAAAEMREEEGEPLTRKLRKLAGRGAFTRRGLYGGLRTSLLVNVVAFEGFFLSYSALALFFPGLPASWLGTALGGAAAGVVSAASVALALNAGNVGRIAGRVRDWWRGRACMRSDVQEVAGECYSAAGFNSVLFVSYKAVLKSLMVAM